MSDAGLFRLALAFSVSVHRPITIQNTLRSALTNRLQHPPDPRYHCSTSYVQPQHRRCRVHRPLPFRPPPPSTTSSQDLTFRRMRSRRGVGIELAHKVVTIIPRHSWRCPTTLRPSSFSVKCHAWNIGRDHRRVHTRPPRRRLVNILSFPWEPSHKNPHRHRIAYSFPSTKPHTPKPLFAPPPRRPVGHRQFSLLSPNDLAMEEYVVFVASAAGQGEFL